MNRRDLEWLGTLPKRGQNEKETKAPSPLDEAMMEQERLLATEIKNDTYGAAKVRSEQLLTEQQAKLAESQARLVEAKRRIADVESGDGKPKSRKTGFVAIGGEVFQDPESDLTLSEALQLAASQKQNKSPSFFVQNPETGEFVEVSGPVVLHQPSPPKILKVDQDGQVAEVTPGHPIVVQQKRAEQPPAWVYANGQLKRLEPGEPLVVTPPPTRQIVMISPDGSVQEVDPNKPIVIRQSAPVPATQPVLPVQPTDMEGNPIGAAIPLPIPMYIEYYKAMREIARDEESHKNKQDFWKSLRDQLPIIASAGQQLLQERAARPQSPTENQPNAGVDMDLRRCSACGMMFGTPKGIADVTCPNPSCPSHQSGPQFP